MKFTKELIKLDCRKVVEGICDTLKTQIFVTMKRQGAVVGVSGGIDSSVIAALSARAVGPEKVIGISMPDKDNSAASKDLAAELARKFGFTYITCDITPALEGAGCYKLREEGFREVFPQWREGWKAKIVLPTNILESGRLNVYRLAIESPSGEKLEKRIPLGAYLKIVAASNMKQRMRMLTLYYQAEVRNYAVVGTANKNEHDQGFFVKYGDGGCDLRPLGEFYKTQVFQIAEYLDVPLEIRRRIPTTETYPAEVSQEEFFFGLNFTTLDQLWLAKEGNFDSSEVAKVMGLTEEQVLNVWKDLDQKKRTTEYLRMAPLGL
ncbi:MAG TPA: NAD(+) synthase [candidate division Zixibacteria bacterium]|nr:NAD(+) synthase [candidate division Zixibacteria bacterium]